MKQYQKWGEETAGNALLRKIRVLLQSRQFEIYKH